MRRPRRPERVDQRDVQGNILQGYGFGFAHYVFVQVADQQAGRRLLGELCEQVTDARPWRCGERPQETLNVALTHRGLRALGLPPHLLAGFAPEFRTGMASRAPALGDVGDSDPGMWEKGWLRRAADADEKEEQGPHLLVTLMARDAQVGRRRFGLLKQRIESDSGLHLLENHLQAALLDHPDHPRMYSREHFGFADGFSQPAIRGTTGRRTREGMGTPGRRLWRRRNRWSLVSPGEFVLGYRGEDTTRPPAPAAPLGRNGSYMVVRKLEQHVDRFRDYLRRQAERDLPFLRGIGPPELRLTAAELSLRQRVVAAKIVGRWFDGRSLVRHSKADDPDPKHRHPRRINRFTYEDEDPHGHGCPLGAHVRRANPRDDLGWGGKLTKRHRIIRRGMPYGEPAFDAYEHGREDYAPGGLFATDFREAGPEGRGLMFICHQASIARQFELIQQRWLNDGDAFWLGGEKDFLTASDSEANGKMTIQGKEEPSFLTPQESFVTLKGGEYFFAPGLSALRALASAYWR